jgi:hypothetical protein
LPQPDTDTIYNNFDSPSLNSSLQGVTHTYELLLLLPQGTQQTSMSPTSRTSKEHDHQLYQQLQFRGNAAENRQEQHYMYHVLLLSRL